jgi:hypothetical protein
MVSLLLLYEKKRLLGPTDDLRLFLDHRKANSRPGLATLSAQPALQYPHGGKFSDHQTPERIL